MTAAPDVDPSLSSAIFARLHPASYLSRFLASSIRPEGRSLPAFRSTTLAKATIQTAEGSCIVRQGNTVIIAGIKAETLDISEEHTHDGEVGDDDEDDEAGEEGYGLGPVDRKRIIVGVELSPMASAKFKPGPPGEESQILTSRIMTILESCPPLDHSSLVIAKGISSWCLYIDLVCISYDGDALGASMLAINGALQDARLPQARYDETLERIMCSQDRSLCQPLRLKTTPLSFSFGIIEGIHLLSDLDAFESALASGSITITLNVRLSSQAEDVAHIQAMGLCSALISHEEANAASINGAVEEDGMIRVKDEEIIAVCLHRARKRCSELQKLLDV